MAAYNSCGKIRIHSYSSNCKKRGFGIFGDCKYLAVPKYYCNFAKKHAPMMLN